MNRLRLAVEYARTFQTFADARRFRALFRGEAEGFEVPVRLRALGGESVICRVRTSDHEVLWDTFIRRYHLPPRDVRSPRRIVDLGANAGYTMAHFAHLYPSADIFGVELDAANAELAERNTAPWAHRCQLTRGAVWTTDGVVEYGGKDAWGFAVGAGSRSAPAFTIPTLFKMWELEHVDYLKMDIEGAEHEIFRGPLDWLDVVATLQVEYHAPATYEELRGILSARGFACEHSRRHGHSFLARRA